MRITANQVTFVRLLTMPLLGASLYWGETARIVAIILGGAIGLTDTLDGYLARKYGPTVLGRLLDPIADKVFIAVAYLPCVDMGFVPAWIVALIFLREFIVTALRSSAERRGLKIQSSYLAKVKTWVQMCTVGLVLLMLVGNAAVVTGVLLTICGACWLGLLVYGIKKRSFHRSAFVGAAAFSACAATFVLGGASVFTLSLFGLVLAITWASASSYIAFAIRELVPLGIHRFDVIRWLGAAAVPLLAIFLLPTAPLAAAGIITIIALEMAYGGLDNLLSHHQVADSSLRWGVRSVGTSVCLALAYALPELAVPLVTVAALFSIQGAAWGFYTRRQYYLRNEDPGGPADLRHAA